MKLEQSYERRNMNHRQRLENANIEPLPDVVLEALGIKDKRHRKRNLSFIERLKKAWKILLDNDK